MPHVSLLFDRDHSFLGELVTHHGALERLLLNGKGEQHMGAYFAEWQIRGIPLVRHVMQSRMLHTGSVFFQERVAVRSHEFWSALEKWCIRHGLVVLEVPEGLVHAWEPLLRLPLEDGERFSMLVAMRAAPVAEQVDWKKTVHAALDAFETRHPNMKKYVADLRKKTAKDLLKKLALNE